jgi:chorismate mutase/prephenate dehydratase
MKVSKAKTLQGLRSRIDVIDKRLVRLLNRRAHLAISIGKLKKVNGQKPFDPSRESEILKNVSKGNKGPLSEEAIKTIYKEVLRQHRRLEHSL